MTWTRFIVRSILVLSCFNRNNSVANVPRSRHLRVSAPDWRRAQSCASVLVNGPLAIHRGSSVFANSAIEDRAIDQSTAAGGPPTAGMRAGPLKQSPSGEHKSQLTSR